MKERIYRPNVAGIVTALDGRILVAERLIPTGAWQFPQGGIEPGESPEAALVRELGEELTLSPQDYRVGAKRGPYRYLFPAGHTKKGYRGQEQTYFQVHLLGAETSVTVATARPEFRTCRWLEPAEFALSWLPEMKRAVYREVFRDFFTVNLT